ncbi:hypothetical protein B0O80DRAFT_455321 [Mortierella sp. GBAus27b]|nr:hypothetical protein B0O80DRAFT_455321 [Mortierella sp. GBAus27b]
MDAWIAADSGFCKQSVRVPAVKWDGTVRQPQTGASKTSTKPRVTELTTATATSHFDLSFWLPNR